MERHFDFKLPPTLNIQTIYYSHFANTNKLPCICENGLLKIEATTQLRPEKRKARSALAERAAELTARKPQPAAHNDWRLENGRSAPHCRGGAIQPLPDR